MNKDVEVLVSIVYDKVKEDLKKKDLKKSVNYFMYIIKIHT